MGLAARTVFQLFFDIASAQPRPGDPLCQGCKKEAEEKNRETKASSHKGWGSKAIRTEKGLVPLMMHGDAVPCASVGKESRIHSDIQIHKEVSSSATKEELMRQEFLPKLGEQSDNQIDNQSDNQIDNLDLPDFWEPRPKKHRR